MGVTLDVLETLELTGAIVAVAGLLLVVALSWWGSRPAKGRRVRDIVRRLEGEDDQR